MSTENNSQNHVQLKFNFKLNGISLSHLVTDVNASATKRKILFPCDTIQNFFSDVQNFSCHFFDNIISAPSTIFI